MVKVYFPLEPKTWYDCNDSNKEQALVEELASLKASSKNYPSSNGIGSFSVYGHLIERVYLWMYLKNYIFHLFLCYCIF